jgi:flagellin
MSLVINTNSIATVTRNYLNTNQANLKTSLSRLASGSRIVNPSDDAGGLAVGNKLAATLNRNTRAQQNVQNSISFLQVQDGALTQVGKILDRMSELKTMSLDVTKNASDIANYDAEFNQLQDQLSNIKEEKFNGISLFTTSSSNLNTYSTEVGDGDITGATKQAQVDTVTIVAGDITAAGAKSYSIALNNTTYTVTEGTEIAAGNTNIQIAAALQTIIVADGTSSVTSVDNTDGTMTLTANTAGEGFTSTVYTNDTGAAAISAAATTANIDNTVKVSLSREGIFKAGVDGDGLITAGTTGNAGQSDGLDLLDSASAASQNLADYTVDDFVTFIQNGATARANNGAEMSRLEASHALLTTNHANLESARSRLMDVDIAVESTHFAKHNILVQSSAAMLSQANSLPNVALQLLG